MNIDQRGSKDVALSVITATLQRAIDNWMMRTAQCGGLTLSMQPARTVLDVANDRLPSVVFRNDEWRRPGQAPHDPSAIGITTVMYVDTPGLVGDGTIYDADIELNNVDYTFTTNPTGAMPRAGTQLADLENTLTHELGHVQGLAHTCWDHQTATPPLDDKGNPVPDCFGALPTSITATTMYPYAITPDETSKRNVSDDDVHGVCDVYGATVKKLGCYSAIEGGGCSAAPLRPTRRWPLGLAGIGACVVAAARRRRR
jgi:hypothetical protein